MDDVARLAGVTKQTVSNVVRGRAVVSARTRARVEEAIAELGYRPNLVARGLATGTTMTIGFIVPTVANPFYSAVVEEVENVLEEHGYHLLLATTRGDDERARRHLTTLSSRSVDALLIASDCALDQEKSSRLDRLGLPVALCAWENDPPSTLPVVTIDYEKAGYLAGCHLRDLGHRRPLVVADLPAHRVRVSGVRRAFAEVGVVVSDDEVFEAPGATTEFGYAAAAQALAAGNRPTCVFATTDAIALGVMAALQHHGLQVPEDVSVVGIDDIPQAAHAHPPLTTVALPKRRMAREAVQMLLQGINSKQPVPPDLSLLSPEVIVRESSATPTA